MYAELREYLSKYIPKEAMEISDEEPPFGYISKNIFVTLDDSVEYSDVIVRGYTSNDGTFFMTIKLQEVDMEKIASYIWHELRSELFFFLQFRTSDEKVIHIRLF